MNHPLQSLIRDVPDFPKPGVLFRDLTPLLASPEAFRNTIDTLVDRYRPMNVAQVVAIESRGFLFGAPLAYALGARLLVVRKPGKLPGACERESFSLEYGEDCLEMRKGMVTSGESALVVDDVLATGGTAAAVGRMLARQGVSVREYAFVIELDFLGGRKALGERNVFSLVRYSG